jgi:uncharacterized protein YraI
MKSVNAKRTMQHALCAAVLLALLAGLADARPVRVLSNVNLRQGPGTHYGVLRTIPRGVFVDVTRCSAEWCTVRWRGSIGYTIARNLALGGPPPGVVGGPVVVEPGPVVVGPPIVYGPRYYRGPAYYWGPRYSHGWRRWL